MSNFEIFFKHLAKDYKWGEPSELLIRASSVSDTKFVFFTRKIELFSSLMSENETFENFVKCVEFIQEILLQEFNEDGIRKPIQIDFVYKDLVKPFLI